MRGGGSGCCDAWGHYWGATLSHPAWKGLTKNASPENALMPLLRNSGTFHSVDEETKGRPTWGRDERWLGPLRGKARTRKCSADLQARTQCPEHGTACLLHTRKQRDPDQTAHLGEGGGAHL